MPIVIGFEGLAGVGKSSVAKKVAEHLGGVWLDKDSDHPRLREERKRVVAGKDVEDRFYFFEMLNGLQLSRARSMQVPYVTLEGSIYRTVATHRILGSMAASAYRINEPRKPDITLYLDLNEDMRLERLISRDGAASRTFWDDELNKRHDELRAEFSAFELPTIDTTGLSVDEVAEQALLITKSA